MRHGIGHWRGAFAAGCLSLIAILLVTGLPLGASAAPVPLDPASWQQSSVGLKTSNGNQSTAGLTITAQMASATSWPFLRLQGGVKQSWGRLAGPIGIDLGQVKIPSATVSGSSESTDWVHDTISISSSPSLALTVSRLSPAVQISTSSPTLRLLAGNVSGNTFDGSTVSSRPASPSYPKYVAYSTGGAIRVATLSSTMASLPSLDSNWVLVWYGTNSHFVDTKIPTAEYGLQLQDYPLATLPQQYAYQADAPILLRFQNAPTSIANSTEGGIDLRFASGAGSVSVLPLYGRDHPAATTTEQWGTTQTLPATATNAINFWVNRLCDFPTGAAETYAYNPTTDTVSITESITFQSACSGGTRFATIPPFLALVADTLGSALSISGSVVDSGMPTEFGPVKGIDGASSYSWSVTGFRTYTDSYRTATNTGSAPTELVQELANQVDRLTQAGHLAPFIADDKMSANNVAGDIYWLNPADALYQLSEILPVLPDPQKTNLLNYLRSERTAYPPETVFNLPLDVGAKRSDFSLYGEPYITNWQQSRQDVFLSRVPLYNFYSLADYYRLTGDPVPSTTMQALYSVLDTEMRERDWATMSTFYQPPISGVIWQANGTRKSREDVVEANRHFAGMLGAVRLAELAGDSSLEGLARSLFVEASVLRLGMARLPRYYYEAGLLKLPAQPDWQITTTQGRVPNYIPNYSWTGPNDDLRQVVVLDQFGASLADNVDETFAIPAYLTAYRDMVPELFRLLGDLDKTETQIYATKVMQAFPNWYVSFAEASFGLEHNLNHPIDAYQIFMEQALLEHVPAATLEKRVDIPWTSVGDLFYMQKLEETIRAYQGWTWSPAG